MIIILESFYKVLTNCTKFWHPHSPGSKQQLCAKTAESAPPLCLLWRHLTAIGPWTCDAAALLCLELSRIVFSTLLSACKFRHQGLSFLIAFYCMTLRVDCLSILLKINRIFYLSHTCTLCIPHVFDMLYNISIFVCEFVRKIWSEYKRMMMRINGACEYTEKFSFEANLIHIRFD